MSETVSFVIDTELSPIYFNDALKFVYQHYLLPHPEIFGNIHRKKLNGIYALSFTVFNWKQSWHIDVEMKAGKPIQVKMTPKGGAPESVLDEVREDLIINVQLFEENIRKSTLYLAWIKGEEIIPEEPPSATKKASDRMFSSSMLLLYMLLFGINIVLFIFLGMYAVIAILGIQLAIVLLADKIYLKMGKWRVTAENPNVHMLQYHLPIEEYNQFNTKFGKDQIIQMKTEIYNKTLALGREPTCELGEEIFAKYGMKCTLERKSAKVVNVYEIVKKAAEKFNMPMPKIVISNSMMANAAATGPSPSHGVVLLTTGLLVQLEEDEILSVVGHELAHLQGRDPLILFGLSATEFLLRIFVFLPLFYFSPYLYLFVAMGMVYFIAKFFEARADLLSAIKIGQPKALAEALRKIGFQKLRYERLPTYKIQSWIRWDPHPPTYFRIDRLEKMKIPVEVKHPLIQSAKDVFNGFKSVF